MPIDVLMPALSPTMKEGNLVKWNKKEGDSVKPGEVMAEIETDKATMEVEAVDGGTIGKILIKEGTQAVKVNEVIAILLKKGEDKSVLEGYTSAKLSGSSAVDTDVKDVKTAVSTVSAVVDSSSVGSVGGQRVFASPLAKRVANEMGVDVCSVSGTGPNGRIVKDDVLNFKPSAPSVGVAVTGRSSSLYTMVPHSGMRKVIAARLVESKSTIPHFYLSVDVNVTELLRVRENINCPFVKQDEKSINKISVNDIVIKASGLALRDFPDVNASWTNDGVMRYNNVDVSVAVSIDSGLITPIVKNADCKSLLGISLEMKDLAKRARENKLKPEEFQGGGFSISNLGMYGIKNFNAIINPPQSAILAVGSSVKQPVIGNDGEVTVASIMNLTLSCDHRVVDGALAALFLGRMKEYLENVSKLLSF